MRARFGVFVIDFGTRQVLRGSQPLHLTPKAYELLSLLVESRPRAMSKAELQKGLWPSTFVDEANLSVLVAELRAALEDDARRPTFVRTVHGFGYSFVAEVAVDGTHHDRAAASDWWLHSDNLHVRLNAGENVVGREPPVEVWIDSGGVSRRHARVVVEGPTVTVEDLGSKNGTWVNGRQVTGQVRVGDGDDVRFGAVSMRLRSAGSDVSTETVMKT